MSLNFYKPYISSRDSVSGKVKSFPVLPKNSESKPWGDMTIAERLEKTFANPSFWAPRSTSDAENQKKKDKAQYEKDKADWEAQQKENADKEEQGRIIAEQAVKDMPKVETTPSATTETETETGTEGKKPDLAPNYIPHQGDIGDFASKLWENEWGGIENKYNNSGWGITGNILNFLGAFGGAVPQEQDNNKIKNWYFRSLQDTPDDESTKDINERNDALSEYSRLKELDWIVNNSENLQNRLNANTFKTEGEYYDNINKMINTHIKDEGTRKIFRDEFGMVIGGGQPAPGGEEIGVPTEDNQRYSIHTGTHNRRYKNFWDKEYGEDGKIEYIDFLDPENTVGLRHSPSSLPYEDRKVQYVDYESPDMGLQPYDNSNNYSLVNNLPPNVQEAYRYMEKKKQPRTLIDRGMIPSGSSPNFNKRGLVPNEIMNPYTFNFSELEKQKQLDYILNQGIKPGY